MPEKNTSGEAHFIGWLPMPATYFRFLLPVAIALLALVSTTAVLVAWSQKPPGEGRWETEQIRTFDGMLFANPYAMLCVPGERGELPRTLLLVEEGKFGALERILSLGAETTGLAVRVKGTLLHRDGRAMLELLSGTDGLRVLTDEETRKLPRLAWPNPELLDETITLHGEIIDPKCYLGAMRPGGGKTHKACAMLCVRGGIPPMLVTRDGNTETFHLLTTANGSTANEMLLQFVGDECSVTGRRERHGDLLVLRVDSVRRR